MMKLRQIIQLKNSAGFSLIEMLISMALLSIVMMISLNVISIVGKTARNIDAQINVTQESSFAAERIRRIVRSADPNTAINVSANALSVTVQGDNLVFTFEPISGNGPDENSATQEYILNETSSAGTQSVMASNIYIRKFNDGAFFRDVVDTNPPYNSVGVKVVFEAYDAGDVKELFGTIVSTQAINRTIILNE